MLHGGRSQSLKQVYSRKLAREQMREACCFGDLKPIMRRLSGGLTEGYMA